MANRIVKVKVAKGGISVDREEVHICLFEKDEVVWKGNKNFKIEFKQPEPFAKPEFSGGPKKGAKSGPPVNGQPGAFYKYTITSAGASPCDPGVRTDP